MNNERKQVSIDVLTLAAISIVAWALVVIMHEIVGHAGFAAIMGIPVRAVSTTTVFLEWDKIKTIEVYKTSSKYTTVTVKVSEASTRLQLSWMPRSNSVCKTVVEDSRIDLIAFKDLCDSLGALLKEIGE